MLLLLPLVSSYITKYGSNIRQHDFSIFLVLIDLLELENSCGLAPEKFMKMMPAGREVEKNERNGRNMGQKKRANQEGQEEAQERRRETQKRQEGEGYRVKMLVISKGCSKVTGRRSGALLIQ